MRETTRFRWLLKFVAAALAVITWGYGKMVIQKQGVKEFVVPIIVLDSETNAMGRSTQRATVLVQGDAELLGGIEPLKDIKAQVQSGSPRVTINISTDNVRIVRYWPTEIIDTKIDTKSNSKAGP